MATVPVPRSYAQILGDEIDVLLSKLGLPSLAVGDPTLSILEAAAQSDLRSSQDIFSLLNATTLDRATGTALDRIGADEDAPRISTSPSTGAVSIVDNSITKKQSTIFQGLPAPIIGSFVVNVADATLFPASGSIYIGRGTTNYEGPVAYTSKTNNTNYWTLNLSAGTQRYHNLGESVIVAQGGNRAVPAGTVVQTPQGNASSSVQFATQFAATVPDGETQIDGIAVTCTQPGRIGNVIAGAINTFQSQPFSGAGVTNPLPFTNGLETESDSSYRERIRSVRQSRSKGTALAITTGVTGIVASDENKTVISASLVTRAGYPATLYIDDGTGYEETDQGIPYETLVDKALGGEQYFQLVNGRPVAKAAILTSLSAPFSLANGMTLAVLVGGQLSQHTFGSADFRAISNASAFEVASSINANASLLFNARPTNNGTKVGIVSKGDANEDIQAIPPALGVDANSVLGFSAGRVDTLRLYKNDRLLSKDGQLAVLSSKTQGLWGVMTSGETLNVVVDGIAIPTSLTTFTDADFVNAGTGYVTLSASNTLTAWAQVFNFKVPGVTCAVLGGLLTLTSNRGRSASASVAVTGGTLVSKGMWAIGSSTGKNFDYELNRNLGQIRLQDSLVLANGDKLTAGSLATRAFIESKDMTTVTIPTGAELWFSVDGQAVVIPTGIGPGTSLVWSQIAAPAWGKRVRITATTAVFANALAGQWLIVNDSAVSAPNRGAWLIANVGGGGTWVEIEMPASWASAETDVLASGGVTVVSSVTPLQRVTIGAGTNYTPASLVAAISLLGATASVYRTTRIRIRTNRFTTLGGDIALVAANTDGLLLNLPVGSAIINQTSHLAAVEAGHAEAGTPLFEIDTVASTSGAGSITMTGLGGINSGSMIVALKDADDFGTGGRQGDRGQYSPITVISGNVLTLERPVLQSWFPGDRVYPAVPYAINAQDQLTAVIDQNTTSKRFVMPMYRRTKPSSGTYGATNTLKDNDNGLASLAMTFGTAMNWADFAVFMHARAKSSLNAGADTNRTILWRFNRFGSEGNLVHLAYAYPTSASQSLNVTSNAFLEGPVDVNVLLPSGAARTGVLDSITTKVGYAVTAGPSAGLWTYTYVFNLSIASAIREVRLNYTGRGATAFTGTVTGGTSAATATVVSDSLAGGATGAGTLVISGVTGTFNPSEAITGTTGAATTSGSQYGVSKLTLTLPSGITNHGLVPGNQVWVAMNGTGTGAGFTVGLKSILETPSGTVIDYIEGTTAIGSTANVGTVSNDTAPVGLGSSTVAVGDIMTVGAATSLAAQFQLTLKLLTVTAGQVTAQYPSAGPGLSATLSWSQLNSPANLNFYPLSLAGCTISAIAASVNALANSPVTAVAVGAAGDTSGSILYATYEVSPNGEGGTTPYYTLSDGLNYVRSTNTPGLPSTDFIFTLKDPVTANLATNSDWANEDVRLVPITGQNLVDYLNTSGPGGLFAAAEVARLDDGRPQIATLTVGSPGSVQIQGGSANGVTTAVLGSAVNVASSYMGVNIANSDSLGLSGGHWVKIQNTVAVPKNRITSSTVLTSLAQTGAIVLSSTNAWDWAGATTGPLTGTTYQIEKHGSFLAFVAVNGAAFSATGVSEGDWVHISGTLGGTVSVRNQGLFRVVRINSTGFWVVNPNGIEEVQTADLAFLAYDSIVPGDQLIINTALWGLNNLGTWTVKSIDLTTYNAGNTNSRFKFALDTTTRTPVAASAGALGTSAGLVQVVEGTPSALYKRIYTISPNTTSPLLADVKFDTVAGYQKVSAAAGSIISSLDKLNFPVSLATGIDGYQHAIGLIAEANKVGYGVESDTATYPGIIAAGANVNIQGPLVRRIQVSLALRVKTGIDRNDIQDQVKSAVAALVNQTGVGIPVAISAIISAAEAVNGVISVVVISPIFGSGNDLISVQPFEKPLVLSLDQDVLVSFVGS